MLRLPPYLLLSSYLAIAACSSSFSVHDDLLAYPQYDVVFSNSLISDTEASSILHRTSSTGQDSPRTSQTKNTEIAQSSLQDDSEIVFDPVQETYELLWLHDEQQLCTIPIHRPPQKNETSEAEARAAEQKELARATDRGWELLRDLEGNCLYFVSGWWSYQFCYNGEVTQFHQLRPQAGKPPFPPQRDPTTPEFTLGKAKGVVSHEDEWGNRVETWKEKKGGEPPKTELQVKGDTRFLVQKMDGGSICDLTGKPRQVEVQFHCMPHVTDRIGFIKEVTTCSYLLVVHTPRLCNDIAFMPPKDHDAYPIVCRVVVPDEELTARSSSMAIESEVAVARTEEQENEGQETPTPKEEEIIIGGIVLGAGNFVGREGQRMPIPANFGYEDSRTVEIIAKAKSLANGGQVEMATEADLEKMDLDPAMVDELRREVQKMAKEKGWKIEVVDAPGEIREILGIVDTDDEEGEGEKSEGEQEEQGSQEVFKDEL